MAGNSHISMILQFSHEKLHISGVVAMFHDGPVPGLGRMTLELIHRAVRGEGENIEGDHCDQVQHEPRLPWQLGSWQVLRSLVVKCHNWGAT